MDYASEARARLRESGFALSATSGRSMRPLIWGGDHCVVVAPLEGEPAVGDMLMFRYGGGSAPERSLVHRLVRIDERGGRRVYVMRGDNRLGLESVGIGAVIGKVVEIHRTSGFRPWHIIPRRKIAVSDLSYRIYTRLWTLSWPVRRICYHLRRLLAGR